MLKSHLNTISHTKFVLIEDSLNQRGNEILDWFVKRHTASKLHCFIFEGSLTKGKAKYSGSVEWHDFTKTNSRFSDLYDLVSRCTTQDVVVFDSLIQIVFQFDLQDVYKLIHHLVNKIGVKQVLTVLHLDLVPPNQVNSTCKTLEYLSTLTIKLQPKLHPNSKENGRISYTFRKPNGKLSRGIEQYHFEHGDLICEKITKPELELIQKTLSGKLEANPEDLATFRIGLTELEKQAREKLVLPYLPKNQAIEDGGAIIYTMEPEDDWDEEDPDDDLDI